MKRVFILCMALCALLAGCRQEQSPAVKDTGTCCHVGPDTTNFMAPVALAVTAARPMIDTYQAFAATLPKIGNFPNPTSFKFSARALRQYLNDAPDVDTLQVFLAIAPVSATNTKRITAVYIGSRPSPLNGQEFVYYFKDASAQNEPSVFDMTVPCPDCFF